MKARRKDPVALAQELLRALGQDTPVVSSCLNAGPMPRPAERGGYVYFIRCLSPELPVKIGHARDIAHRTSMLQCGSPYRLVLVGYYWHEQPSVEESRLHKRYAPHCIRGEWFASNPDLELEISVIHRLRITAVSRAVASVLEPKTFEWRGEARDWKAPR